MKIKMNPLVFREYDIRGIAEKDLSDDFSERLGLAYAKYISDRTPAANRSRLTVSVGEDCRLSSPQYAKALISGLRKGGLDVIHLGNCPTPATYFSLFHLELDGGIMITASHLPADHNGFKLCIGRDAIYGEQIQQLKKIMESNLDSVSANLSSGSLSSYPIVRAYTEYLLTCETPHLAKKIVIDCGNGNGSQVAPGLFKQLGAHVTELFCEMDGSFPNHTPDPSLPKNMEALIAKVKETGADFGIGIDGDADRIGIVDENGRMIFGDELLIIFSREILKKHAGASVVSEVKASYRLYQDIEKHGGHGVMWKTGHSLIEAKMKEISALLGGEMSGHMFFSDKYLGYDDAIYAALRIYNIASNHSEPFSMLLSDLPSTVSTPEIRLPCDDKIKFALVKRVQENLAQNPLCADAKTTLIDGIRVDFSDGWGLMRASNTEPALSLRFEAVSQDRLTEIRNIFENALAEARPKNLTQGSNSISINPF